MRKRIILALTVLLLGTALQTARFYSGLNVGVAWDWGGVELVGEPGLFFCPPLPYAVDC